MDGDPAVEQQLDIFSLILPLPYRVAIIFTLGILLQPAPLVSNASNVLKVFGHGLLIYTTYQF